MEVGTRYSNICHLLFHGPDHTHSNWILLFLGVPEGLGGIGRGPVPGGRKQGVQVGGVPPQKHHTLFKPSQGSLRTSIWWDVCTSAIICGPK